MFAFILVFIMCFFAWKILSLVCRLTFGVMTFAVGIFFLPIIFVMLLCGLMIFAIPLLIVGFVAFLIVSVAKAA